MSKNTPIQQSQHLLVVEKAKADQVIDADSQSIKIIFWYIFTSAIWLLFGTLVGEYLGLKFIWLN
ncbi:MAG TPA: hypothetical protein DF712_11570 [Balneola sp.]|jgi:cytochrome c oxidase cbb3-type subunit 1|nr:hypothetical protein [Bacteroidota bacterium]MAC06051.1 hypothetical protein [Balneola sp.]MAO77850.1 hypothetical protein [Balneola sp.]MBF63304.1 hypothetical protein [Balneola sp.]HAH52342.1 hypothetical protein [Balneola sp.]|tara:strand:+ start:6311 stop:6505 length:195 start_codon:yes stop_codon:yes gene_type:complete